ncbi:hypothetical protein Vadar_015476 [Vaccinium darrowii]|uniref:Uncharacterized protein n=1 Tax=Vaccinium darrowii TaxID=229202 RepID=A0ACB7YLU9_9ERIC|nr:hypothetical protein Vadar_015476 [Vaccinium darrowii]
MGMLGSSRPPVCPREEHCSEWAKQYLKYCLCNMKDGVSLALGLVSVISWGVAEIPQIITNYRTKSTEGLSIAFLMTWIAGDMFNLFGCMLEPATLPTQFYMAILYTLTTSVLAGQTIYYGHIYHRLKSNRQNHKTEAVEKKISCSSGVAKKQDNNGDGWENVINDFSLGVAQSSPIPLPAVLRCSSLERELYYMSARSLSRGHTPTSGSFLAQRITLTTLSRQNTCEEPLLGGVASTQFAPPNSKTMLCAFSAVTFVLGTLNLRLKESNGLHIVPGKPYKGVVLRVGRKLLQVSGGFLQETGGARSSRIGTLLGWGMAAIYMGGRLPQICLNIRRGHLEGLSPFMFIFALVGNITYVASILVKSLEWSKLSANLPWLVDAGGCAVLDTFILIQNFQGHWFRHTKSNCS